MCLDLETYCSQHHSPLRLATPLCPLLILIHPYRSWGSMFLCLFRLASAEAPYIRSSWEIRLPVLIACRTFLVLACTLHSAYCPAYPVISALRRPKFCFLMICPNHKFIWRKFLHKTQGWEVGETARPSEQWPLEYTHTTSWSHWP